MCRYDFTHSTTMACNFITTTTACNPEALPEPLLPSYGDAIFKTTTACNPEALPDPLPPSYESLYPDDKWDWYHFTVNEQTKDHIIQEKDAVFFSLAIKDGWEKLFLMLGVSPFSTDLKILNPQNDITLSISILLIKWWQQFHKVATVKSLISAITLLYPNELKIDMEQLKEAIREIAYNP